ncbi:MAG: hypothetical protein IJO24_09025 [Clostridia bacterium]|nr:hypothetical protein [Clostridia bacterium]
MCNGLFGGGNCCTWIIILLVLILLCNNDGSIFGGCNTCGRDDRNNGCGCGCL